MEGTVPPKNNEGNVIRSAWIDNVGTIPVDVERDITRAYYLDAVIKLAEEVIGRDLLQGWRLKFTDAGPPYKAELFDGLVAQDARSSGTSKVALSLAFLDAVARWQ